MSRDSKNNMAASAVHLLPATALSRINQFLDAPDVVSFALTHVPILMMHCMHYDLVHISSDSSSHSKLYWSILVPSSPDLQQLQLALYGVVYITIWCKTQSFLDALCMHTCMALIEISTGSVSTCLFTTRCFDSFNSYCHPNEFEVVWLISNLCLPWAQVMCRVIVNEDLCYYVVICKLQIAI